MSDSNHQAGTLSTPSTEFGAIPAYLKMPPEQLKAELKKVHPNTLAVKLINYDDQQIAIIASALPPDRRKEMMATLKLLRGDELNKVEKRTVSSQLIAMLCVKPFHLNYKKILLTLAISLTFIYYSLGQLP